MDVTTANRFHLGEIVISSLLRVGVIMAVGAELWHLALYEALMFLFFELLVLDLRDELDISPDAMRDNHTNLE